MEYKLIDSKNILNRLGVGDIPSNIDMFYDLSYQISTFILNYRVEHKLTQKQFAELLEVKQPMVSKLESGNYNISLQSLCDVMTKLKTRIELGLKAEDKGIVLAPIDYCAADSLNISIMDIEELGVAI